MKGPHRNTRKRRPARKRVSAPHARLIVQISVKGRSPQRLRGAVERLALIQTEKVAQPLDIPSRPLDETTRQHTPWSVELLVLPGAFRGVELGLIIEAIGDRDN